MKRCLIFLQSLFLILSTAVFASNTDDIERVIPNIKTLALPLSGKRLGGPMVISKSFHRVPKGETFTVGQRASLILNKDSLLYIEEGGKLIIEADSKFDLNAGGMLWCDGVVECYGICTFKGFIRGKGNAIGLEQNKDQKKEL